MTSPTRVLLLGTPMIVRGDQTLALSRRQLRGILFFLSCQQHPLTRDTLGMHFWEHKSEADIRKDLRVSLSRLRNELNDPDFLIQQGDFLQLDPTRVQSDVREFLLLYEHAAALMAPLPPTAPLPEAVREVIHKALGLWRVRRFRAVNEFHGTQEMEEWAAGLEYRLNLAHKHLLERMAEHELSLGRLDSAAARLHEALEIEPLEDNLNLQYWRALERAGRFKEALSACQRARDTYERNGLTFSAEMSAVFERMRGSNGRPQTAPLGGPRHSLRLPMIGRDEEVRRMREAYRRRSPVILLGETSSGKSRMLREWIAGIEQETQVAEVSVRPSSEGTSLQVMADLMCGSLSVEDWRSLSSNWLNVLSLLVPELAALTAQPLPPPSKEGVNQAILFEAIHRALAQSARRCRLSGQTLVLALDDAQRCDETALNALMYLFENGFFTENAWLVLAVRTDEISPLLAQILRRLEGEFGCSLIRLSALEPEHIEEILRMVFQRRNHPNQDPDPIPKLAARLAQDTGGNPFFLLETLRMMLEYSTDPAEALAGGQLPLPVSLHTLVHDRLERLSPEAMKLLSLAAVIGSEFPLEFLEKSSRVSPETLAGLIQELEQARLLCACNVAVPKRAETPGILSLETVTQVRYRFCQERVRDMILTEMSPAWRRLHHRHVAEMLKQQEDQGNAIPPALLADHLQQAGEEVPAFLYWLKTAAQAGRLFSVNEQDKALRRAEAILDQVELAIHPSDVLNLYSMWIESAFTQANAERARRAAETLLRHGWRRENPTLICAGYLGLAAAEDLSENGEQGLAYLEQAKPFLPSDDLRMRLMYHFRRGGMMVFTGRMDEAIAELEDAIRVAERAGDNPQAVEQRAAVGYRLAGALLVNGWPERALAVAERAMSDSRNVMSHVMAARAVAIQALIHYYLGHYPLADQLNQMALRMAVPMQNRRLIGQVYASLAQLALNRGLIDEGWKLARQALEAGLQAGFPRLTSQAYRLHGDVFRLLVADQEAIPWYRKAVEAGGDTHAGMDALLRLGLTLVQSGQAEEGMVLLDRCIRHCRQAGIGLHLYSAMGARALALTTLGQKAEAISLAEEVAIEGVKRSLHHLRALAFIPWAHFALMEGRLDEARQRSLALAHLGEETDNPFMELTGYSNAIQAGDRSREVRDRMALLLDRLDTNCRDAELRSFAEKRLAQYRAMLA